MNDLILSQYMSGHFKDVTVYINGGSIFSQQQL